MAHVTKENIGLLNEKITVTVEKDDYLPSFEKAIKSYSKTANIPGFRKGMVPTGMVRKMYGSSVFADEVIKSVEKSLQDYMTNEKLEIFAQPLPLPDSDAGKLDMNQPSEYAFSFEVGLKPDFALPDFGGMPLKKYKIDVTEDMVSNEVNRILKDNRNVTEADNVPGDNFEISVQLTETDAEGNTAEAGIDKQYYFSGTDFTSAFKEQLTGKSKEDTLSFRPAEALEPAAKTALFKELELNEEDGQADGKTFRLTILRINIVTPAEQNDELYQKLFPSQEIHSESDFRERVRQSLQQNWQAPVRNQLHDQIFHQLVDHTQIPFPESFLKRWMQNNESKPKTEEEVEAEFPGFVNSLKWTLILDKIMVDQNIHIHREDIEASAKQQLFGYLGGSLDLDMEQSWVNDYVQRMMNDKRFVEDTSRRLEVEKAFSWIETQVHPEEVAISEDDFTKMQSEHQHHH